MNDLVKRLRDARNFLNGKPRLPDVDTVLAAANHIEAQSKFSEEACKILARLADGEMSDARHTALRDAARAILFSIGK